MAEIVEKKTLFVREEADVQLPDARQLGRGLTIERVFSKEGAHPFDEVAWETRDAVIKNHAGQAIFEQKGVEFPKSWSRLASNVVASKYFYGDLARSDRHPAEGGREGSLQQLIHRVTRTISDWGIEQGYFATKEEGECFYKELTWLCLHQYGSFNSPVWFNVGLHHQYGVQDTGGKVIYGWDRKRGEVVEVDPYERPQASACFIIAVEDSIDDIWQLMSESARLFKFGSGVGADWSRLRSSREKLSGGGTPSGPVSFMRVQDATGGTIKSGGKTRRAAIMQTLKCWHPDIMEFVEAKQEEEKKAWALIEEGYDGSFNGPAYGSVAFQNVNQSVRVTDDFMRAALEGKKYDLRSVTTGEVIEKVPARDVLYKIAEGTYICGDPGVQYEDTIQRWHTVKNTGPINSSNPCVTGDTLVATGDGLRRIDSMLGETPRVVGLDGRLHRATRVLETGVKPVYRLRTRSGYEVKLTADHPVWTENRGDVPAAELTKDDVVRLVAPSFGPVALPPEVAEYVGLMLGDGCVRGEVATLTMNGMTAGGVVEKAAAVVGRFERWRGAVQATAGETGRAVATTSAAVREMLARYAVLGEGNASKRLTGRALQLKREAVAALLRGLFTADGTVADYDEKRRYVVLDSASEELLRQVQILLLGFGIKSKLYRDRRLMDRALLTDGRGGLEEYRVEQMHSLRISRSSSSRFEKEIGFMPESPKAAALQALNQRVGTGGDAMVDTVASLELLGEEPVYDLTEPVTDHFVANGVAVHNCSEYMHLDNSACNLASLNLRKFQRRDGTFDVERFRAATRIFITAMEILVDNAGYPSRTIARNSHDYRPLGLGFANLGALLMAMGLSYDSDEGRAVAGAVMAIEHCEAYARSAEIAANKKIGPFPGFEKNREPMLEVMRLHQAAVDDIHPTCPDYLLQAARASAARMVALGERHGYRNAQATVLAPTGCLIPGTLVNTSQGLRRLGDLGDQTGAQWQDVDFDVMTDEGPQRATKFYVNGISSVATVKTKRGYELTGTPQHRIRVVDAEGEWVWRRIGELQKSERIPLLMHGHVGTSQEVTLPLLDKAYHTSRSDRERVPGVMTPELAELLGYFMGDGSLHDRGIRFSLDAQDKDTVERVSWLVEHCFGVLPVKRDRGGYLSIVLHSRRIARWFEGCGFAKRKPNKDHEGKGYVAFTPDAVLRTNDLHVYAAFLRGLFDADGTVEVGLAKVCSKDRGLIEEARAMLLMFGVPTDLRTSIGGKSGRKVYHLRIVNSFHQERFNRTVGFNSQRKRAATTNQLVAPKGDIIPLTKEQYQAMEPIDTHTRNENERRQRRTCLASIRRYRGLPRHQALALLERIHACVGADDEEPKEAAWLEQRLSFFYDRVERCTLEEKEVPTYDLSVPENVTYTANGFVSHNTIAFMMDCDTTGIEPDIALVKYKLLAGKGDGMLKIVNQTVRAALKRLGYSEMECETIVDYVDQNDTIEGAPHLKAEHLPVFDCAFKPFKGQRSIHHMGHIKMMAAVQPFVSGALSKTVNMPESSTVEDIMDAYVQGWKLGLKAVAIYRENSKRSQPLSTSKGGNTKNKAAEAAPQEAGGDGALQEAEIVEKIVEKVVYKPVRKRLPDERPSITHKFSIAGHEGYLHIGLYPDTKMPGEIFITMAKQGSTIAGLMDAFATSISIALQYGVPLEDLCNKFSHMRFEPSGFTNNRQIPIAKSIMDYIFRYLSLKFLHVPVEEETVNPNMAVAEEARRSGPALDESQMEMEFEAPARTPDPLIGATVDAFIETADRANAAQATHADVEQGAAFQNQADAPACPNCGSITVRAGSCYSCPNCGSTSGCG